MSPDIMLQQGGFCQYVESHETSTVRVPVSTPPGFDPLWYVVAQPVGTLIKAVNKLPSLWTKTVSSKPWLTISRRHQDAKTAAEICAHRLRFLGKARTAYS
jgi:hypothetical protein